MEHLATEAVKGSALALECVDNVHGSDGLPASVLGVGDRVTDDVLKEDLEDTTSLLVDEARDALDTTTACETADGGLGDSLDVVPQDLAVPLGSSLAESLSSNTEFSEITVNSVCFPSQSSRAGVNSEALPDMLACFLCLNLMNRSD